MNDLFTAIPTAITAFTATNLDDVLILLLFFSQVNTAFQKKHIVIGQYLGFGALVLGASQFGNKYKYSKGYQLIFEYKYSG